MKEFCCPKCKRCVKVHNGVKVATCQCNTNIPRVQQMVEQREQPK